MGKKPTKEPAILEITYNAMRNRWVLLGFAASLVVTLAVTMVLKPLFRHGNEPRAAGSSLSFWVRLEAKDFWHGGNASAEAAISDIGSNALPFLLEWIQYEPRPSELRKIAASLPDYVPATFRPMVTRLCEDTAQIKAEGAIYAFRQLDGCTERVATDLLHLLNEPGASTNQVFRRARLALRSLRSDALIPLCAAQLADTNSLNRAVAAALIGSCPMATNVDVALNALIKGLTDRDPNVVHDTGFTLAGPSVAKLAIPTLINTFAKSTNDVLRSRIIWVLGEIGLNAESARPLLSQALNDSDACVRLQATNALEKWSIEVHTNPPPQKRRYGLKSIIGR